MKLSEATLLAFVDGKLDPEERADVEAALAQDPAAQDMVRRLSLIGADDIREGLQAAEVEPLPLDLARRIQEMPIPDQETPRAEPTRQAEPPVVQQLRPAPPPRRWQSSGWAMAASIMMLVLGGGIGLWVGSQYGQNQVAAVQQAQAEKSWMVRVAEYQKLYVRDTVNNVNLTPDEQVANAARLSDRLGHQVVPPDLKDQDLTFKRGQILDFDGSPIVQLVYLPDEGKPIALCIIATDKADHGPQDGAAEGLNFTHWAEDGLGYILIGEADQGRIRAMAEEARRQI